MFRDRPRDDLPKDCAWNIVDYLPNDKAQLFKRGGYAYASADISATVATTSYITAGIIAEYAASTKHVVVDEDGRVIEVTSASTTTDIGAGVTTLQNPVMHRATVIIPASGGATNPKSLTNTGSYTLADLGGSPPQAKYATVFKDRTVLANTTAQPQRVYFSDAGDPAGWDTTNTYWDFPLPVTGVRGVGNVLLVFHTGYTSRLIGSVPPPQGDFRADDRKFNYGCTDARSIASYNDQVIFASPEGIYITDGLTAEDMTKQAGMLSYWQETLASYSSSTYTIVGEVIKDDYWYAVMDGSSFVDAGMISLSPYEARSWVRHSNIDARCMYASQGATDELYFGRRGAARVGKISTCYLPTSTVKNDGDGTAVAPVLETAYYKDKPGKKTWRRVYVNYDLRDSASDNPTLTVSYITSPEATSYTNVTDLAGASDPLDETTELTRVRRYLNKTAHGMAFKITQSNASSATYGYELEAEVHGRERSRV